MINSIKSIDIENTSLCGADCIMCLRNNLDYYYGVMPFELFKKSVKNAYNIGINIFVFGAFGDPLMDNLFEERLKYIKKENPNAKIGITTTGHLLDEKNTKLLCDYADSVKISNYGFTKETYEAVHKGKLVYEEVKQNINYYLNIPGRPRTILTFLILPQNEGDLENWKNYYEPICDEINVWKPHNWGGNINTGFLGTITSKCRKVLELSGLVIRADGRVSLCSHDINNKLIIGDINTKELDSIIESEAVKMIQNIHNEGTILESELPCKNCDQIRDRNDALVYTNNPSMVVGKYSLFKN